MPLFEGPTELVPVLDVKDLSYDLVLVVTDKLEKLTGNLACLKTPLEGYAKIDQAFDKQPVLIYTDVVPCGRVIFSGTGPLNRDYDDVRRFADAATAGIKRALQAGCSRPLFVRPIDDSFEKAGLVATLAVLHVIYVPIELREAGQSPKVNALGIWCNDIDRVTKGIAQLNALESGRKFDMDTGDEVNGIPRIVARDINGSDPERMAPPRVEEYMRDAFKDSGVQVDVISDIEELHKDFPLLAAVNRAADSVQRHKGRILFLEYCGGSDITRTLFLVGKGITYDTGGADVKTGGAMAGMSRDKGGASAVAGFMKALSILKPENIRVVAGMPMVRNSVGEESYVADEVVTSRAGKRVRVGNTDAEGRMVMADVLCRMKELAVEAVNPHLMTIATLTGHAERAMGPAYSVIMDNGPARQRNTAQAIQVAGDECGDPFEISTIRREDYEFHTDKSDYAELIQCITPSTRTNRGHQCPSAFLIMASGLDKHGIDSRQPLPYSHVDIAGPGTKHPDIPTAAPVVALVSHFVLDQA